jgi:hypothetical protein
MIGSPNLLEIEDMVKGLPDQMLLQQAQAPSGQIPQFLLVSEIQRRSDMRKKYEAQQAQPEATVADQIVQEGIMSTRPPMQPQMPMEQMPMEQPMMPPMGQPQGIAALPSPEMGMAEGGIVSMFEGGDAPSMEELRAIYQGFTDEQILNAIQQQGLFSSDEYSPFGGISDLASSESVIGRIVDESIAGSQKRISDLESRKRKEILKNADPITAEEQRVFTEDLISFPGKELGVERKQQGLSPLVVKGVLQTSALEDMINKENINKSKVGVSRKDVIAGLGSDTEQMSKDAAAKTSANVQGGGKEVQATSAVSKLMNLLGTPKEVPKIDDLIQETKDEALSGALMSLGAGIASGNLSQGITAAGKTALDARGKARALEAEQRLAEAKAIDDVTARDIGILGTMAGLEIDREKIESDIEIAATALSRELAKQTSLDERETFRQIASLAKSLVGTMKQAPNKDGKMVPTGEMYTVEEAVAAAAASLGMSVPASMGQLTGGGSGKSAAFGERARTLGI